MKFSHLGLIVLGLLFGLSAQANWHDEHGGATQKYYNSKYRLEWRQPLGDWVDAEQVLQGEAAFLSKALTSSSTGLHIELDVTQMLKSVHAERDGDNLDVDFFLRSQGDFKFSSRESGQFSPSLEFYIGTHLRQFFAQRDTQLDSSTNKNLGQGSSVKVGRRSNGLVGFSVPASLINAPDLRKITLRLHIAKVYGGGATLRLFRVAIDSGAVKQGYTIAAEASADDAIASGYPNDQGIGEDSRVLFFDNFDDHHSDGLWGQRGRRVDLVAPWSRNPPYNVSLSLEVTVREGTNRGLNRRYKFKANQIDEPEEAFFRYYLRLAPDWNSDVSGGKFPGFAGTYGKAGWGGRKSTPEGGWSARGFFFSSSNNQRGELRTPIGNYVYHLEQPNRYGNDWVWSENGGALLENDRWYSVEQQIKLNTPGLSDGILRGWLDGRLVFEKTNLRFRGSTKLKIEEVWFNVYHGGGDPAPRDLVLYLDNVVVARNYIGPIHSP